MLYNFANCISIMATHTSLTVTRPGATTFTSDFHTSAGTASTFTIIADAHPCTKKLIRSPEGDYGTFDYKLQTATVLLKGDLISIDSKSYQVELVDDHTAQGGFCIAFMKAVA